MEQKSEKPAEDRDLREEFIPPPRTWRRDFWSKAIIVAVGAVVLAALSSLLWPTIAKPLGLDALNLSRFWAAIIVAYTFSLIGLLVYGVAKKTLWEFLELLIVPLVLSVIGFGFTAQQEARQQQQADEALQHQEEGAQNAALQAYLDQMSHLMLEKNLSGSEEGAAVFTLAQARTITVLSQVDEEPRKTVSSFLIASGLLRKPALLAKTDLRDAKLPEVVLHGGNLAGTQLIRADLADAELIKADFSAKEKVGEDANLIIANLTKANLTKAALQEADLAECTLDKVTLTKAALQGADLSSASLQDANLSYAALQGADLSSAESTLNQKVAPFPFLKQVATNLTDANLRHATLQDADLSNAVLENTNLTNAVLTDANLTDAYLSDADLTDAKGWTEEQLSAARSLEGATMPDGETLKSDKMPDGPPIEEWLKNNEGRGSPRGSS